MFIEPFQVKAKFYPMFFFVILTIADIRVDLLIPIIFGIICHFTRVKKALILLSSKLDERFVN